MSYEEGNYGSGSRGGYRGGFGGDRRSSYSGSSEPKPVKVGDEVEVKIEGTASKGDGIAKKDGFVIFVKGARAGRHREGEDNRRQGKVLYRRDHTVKSGTLFCLAGLLARRLFY